MSVLILSAAVDVLYKSIFSRLALRSVYAITVGVFRKIPFNYSIVGISKAEEEFNEQNNK